VFIFTKYCTHYAGRSAVTIFTLFLMDTHSPLKGYSLYVAFKGILFMWHFSGLPQQPTVAAHMYLSNVPCGITSTTLTNLMSQWWETNTWTHNTLSTETYPNIMRKHYSVYHLRTTEASATKTAKHGLQMHAELSLQYGHSNTLSCSEHRKTYLYFLLERARLGK
jgi:hypothetical protein